MSLLRCVPMVALSVLAGVGLHSRDAGAAALMTAPRIEPPIVAVADADHPYSNIDHSNDAGNNTGDSQVDQLNAQQLNENYRGPYYIGRPPPPGVRPPRLRPPPPPVFYRPPSPGYYAPPPGYPPPVYPPPGY